MPQIVLAQVVGVLEGRHERLARTGMSSDSTCSRAQVRLIQDPLWFVMEPEPTLRLVVRAPNQKYLLLNDF